MESKNYHNFYFIFTYFHLSHELVILMIASKKNLRYAFISPFIVFPALSLAVCIIGLLNNEKDNEILKLVLIRLVPLMFYLSALIGLTACTMSKIK